MKIILISALMFLCVSTLDAQLVSDGIVLPNTSEYLHRSEINGVTYKLSIYVPQQYKDSVSLKFPVVYFLDGNLWLPLASSVIQSVNKMDAVEPFIMVGIGYEVENFKYDIAQRTFDYSPTQVSSADSSMTLRYQTPVHSGGAYSFLQVLEEEIVPFIDSAFRTNTERTIAGHSMGGLFVTYALLEKPRLFSNYIIASPAIWWDEYILLEQLKAKKKIVLPDGKIFLGIGGNETKMMRYTASKLNGELKKKVKEKDKYRYEVFGGYDHFTVIPSVITRSLVFVHANPSVSISK